MQALQSDSTYQLSFKSKFVGDLIEGHTKISYFHAKQGAKCFNHKLHSLYKYIIYKSGRKYSVIIKHNK